MATAGHLLLHWKHKNELTFIQISSFFLEELIYIYFAIQNLLSTTRIEEVTYKLQDRLFR